jgi:hypothetical protein
MKFLMTAVALATLAATPAFAAKHTTRTANQSYAYAVQDSGVVVVDGQIVGRDPDANVRLSLLRSYPAGGTD